MTSTSSREATVATYGGWRRARGIGLAGLGSGQTFTVLAAAGVLLVVGAVSVRTLLVLVPILGAAVAAVVVGWDGLPVSYRLLRAARWLAAARGGEIRYRAPVAVDHPHAWDLPGVLAPTRLITAEDGRGGTYGLVWDRRSGRMTATLRVAATSTWLADQAESAAWVAAWGSWLAGLGHLPLVQWVTVTVDTAPESGSTLRDQVARLLAPAAPAAARAIMAQLVEVSPQAAADVDTRVSITFDPAASPAKPSGLVEAAAEIGHTLSALESGLGSCGVTVLGRASAAELAGAVRVAFDPTARGEVDRLLAPGATHTTLLSWREAGPVAAVEGWASYQHDPAMSVSWVWREAPRQAVPATVLARLLTPGPFDKRVSVQYRPLSAGAASRVLEEQVNAATFHAEWRRRTGREATARDTADQARARQAAAEEAAGAGVVLACLYVTATVTDPGDLARAVADIEARADAAKVRLRRLYGGQAAGFATTLPCGICPPALTGAH